MVLASTVTTSRNLKDDCLSETKMLASVHQLSAKENFTKVKMEEQTVPSAGFSPQPDPYDSGYMIKYSPQGYGGSVPVIEDPATYSNLADTFDLSLLGDSYDDSDMATVPSPSSWSAVGNYETTSWQQMSLYAASPSGDHQNRAISPDCKPVVALSPVHHPFSDNINNTYGSTLRPTTPSGPVPCDGVKTEVVGCDKNLLLRQCLEDTSFQQKCNFRPMDLPSSTLLGEGDSVTSREMGPNTSGDNNFELNQIEPVFSMAFAQIRNDIQNACASLGISPDPYQWSGPDVRSWLTHTLSSLPGTMMGDSASSGNNVTMALSQFWNLDGRSLCLLTEEEFRHRDPVYGSQIFNHLELWKALQTKGCSTHLPDMKTEVSFPGPSNVFDLEQLLLSPEVAAPPRSSSAADLHSLGETLCNPVPEQQQQSFGTTTASQAAPSPLLESATSPASSASFPSPVAPESMHTDDDDDEDEDEDEKKPGVKSKGSGVSKSGAHIHLWQFLKELLASPQQHGSCIRWLDQSRGVFKIEDSVRVARLWGLRKNRPAMNYDKLSRSIRQYYRKGIMKKTERSQRLVYQFCHPYGL